LSENICPRCNNPRDPRSIDCIHCTQRQQEEGKAARENIPLTNVSIVNINIPFRNLVGFMVKASIAAIPAFIIIMIIYTFAGGIMAGLLYSFR
jgi:hypothetical protein